MTDTQYQLLFIAAFAGLMLALPLVAIKIKRQLEIDYVVNKAIESLKK